MYLSSVINALFLQSQGYPGHLELDWLVDYVWLFSNSNIKHYMHPKWFIQILEVRAKSYIFIKEKRKTRNHSTAQQERAENRIGGRGKKKEKHTEQSCMAAVLDHMTISYENTMW